MHTPWRLHLNQEVPENFLINTLWPYLFSQERLFFDVNRKIPFSLLSEKAHNDNNSNAFDLNHKCDPEPLTDGLESDSAINRSSTLKNSRILKGVSPSTRLLSKIIVSRPARSSFLLSFSVSFRNESVNLIFRNFVAL